MKGEVLFKCLDKSVIVKTTLEDYNSLDKVMIGLSIVQALNYTPTEKIRFLLGLAKGAELISAKMEFKSTEECDAMLDRLIKDDVD